MRSLNLDQLRALEAVVELASFTGAARQLNLSQSAVSVQIRELEERLGVRLLDRLGKKAYPTEAGREVIAHARRISEEVNSIADAMRRIRDGWIGRVHIGAALTALIYLLPPALKGLHAEHPGIDILVSTAPTPEMLNNILRNDVDIGLVTMPVEDTRLSITPLHEEPLVAILPASARGVPKTVTPAYVAEQFLVLEFGAVSALVRKWLSSNSAQAPRRSMTVSGVEAVKVVVAAGMGMSIVPAMSVSRRSDDVVVRPLTPPLTRTLGLVQHRNKPEDNAFRIVRAALMTLGNISESSPKRRVAKAP
jgi:DNA-binding transcriptional LysR family regulator